MILKKRYLDEHSFLFYIYIQFWSLPSYEIIILRIGRTYREQKLQKKREREGKNKNKKKTTSFKLDA